MSLVLVSVIAGSALAAKTPQTKPVKWMRGIYIAESPVPTPVAPEVLHSSARIAAQDVNGVVLHGSGQSMQPLYAPGTVLVVAPTSYDALKRGQTVIYHRAGAAPVAHVLIAKTGRGWRAAGLNNKLHDPVGVTAENLFGVVVAAFESQAGASLASR